MSFTSSLPSSSTFTKSENAALDLNVIALSEFLSIIHLSPAIISGASFDVTTLSLSICFDAFESAKYFKHKEQNAELSRKALAAKVYEQQILEEH